MDTESAASFFPSAWVADLIFCTWLDNFLTKEGFLEAAADKKTIISCAEQFLDAKFGTLRFKPESEQLFWSDCSRLITNCIIYYNATLLSRLLEITETAGEDEQVTRLGRGSPIAWQHINFHGRFEFLDPPAPINLESVVRELAQGTVNIYEALD